MNTTCEYCYKICLSKGGLTNHQNACPQKRRGDRSRWFNQGAQQAQNQPTTINNYYYKTTYNDNSTTIVIQQQIAEKYCADMDKKLDTFLRTALEGIKSLKHLPKAELQSRLIEGVTKTGDEFDKNVLLALLDKDHSFEGPDGPEELDNEVLDQVETHLGARIEKVASVLNEALDTPRVTESD